MLPRREVGATRMNQDTFSEVLQSTRLIGIIRGLSPTETKRIAGRLWETGVRLVEIPLHSDTSQEAFTQALQIKSQYPGALLGVGSVRDSDDCTLAVSLGTDFTVSPGLFPEVCDRAKSDGLAHLPGVFTPTEIGHALAMGFETVKLFPASVYEPAGLKALTDPFPEVKLVAVGGVDPKNAHHYFAQGAAAVGMGSALTSQLDAVPLLMEEISNKS